MIKFLQTYRFNINLIICTRNFLQQKNERLGRRLMLIDSYKKINLINGCFSNCLRNIKKIDQLKNNLYWIRAKNE